ncbi:snRNA-activating protein complex subunit 3 [Smittium mucronatum]|uniref:snRNA-activating protein complex subunit 3 n=1 Tax=Smittium mucronatum TaxID=133383 RepID=A0A1R0GWQ2_9FUNG|nr:snRNA-activating protein complex subunit 3 [Smittium mucronatum]
MGIQKDNAASSNKNLPQSPTPSSDLLDTNRQNIINSPSSATSSNQLYSASVFNPSNIRNASESQEPISVNQKKRPRAINNIRTDYNKVTELEIKFRKIGNLLKTSKLNTLSKKYSEIEYPLKYRPPINFLIEKPSAKPKKTASLSFPEPSPTTASTVSNLSIVNNQNSTTDNSHIILSGINDNPSTLNNFLANYEKKNNDISVTNPKSSSASSSKYKFTTYIVASFTWPIQMTKGIYSLTDKYGNFKPHNKNKMSSYKVKSSVRLSDFSKAFKCGFSNKRLLRTKKKSSSSNTDASLGCNILVVEDLVYYDNFDNENFNGFNCSESGDDFNSHSTTQSEIPPDFKSDYYRKLFTSSNPKNYPNFRFKRMDQLVISNLPGISLGHPYLFVHHDDCEHLIYFDEVIYSPSKNSLPPSISPVINSHLAQTVEDSMGHDFASSLNNPPVMTHIPVDYNETTAPGSESILSPALPSQPINQSDEILISNKDSFIATNPITQTNELNPIGSPNCDSSNISCTTGLSESNPNISTQFVQNTFDIHSNNQQKTSNLAQNEETDQMLQLQSNYSVHSVDGEPDSIEQIFSSRFSRKRCRMCLVYPAAFVTRNDFHSGETPCFFCKTCYRNFHYDKNNVLLLDHKVYPYFY